MRLEIRRIAAWFPLFVCELIVVATYARNNFIKFYALHVVAEMQFDKVPETGKIKSNVQIISMNFS